MALFSLDAGVADEATGMISNPALDPYNPDNGYVADGTTLYPPEFVERFQKAVGARSNRIIETLQHRLEVIEAGNGLFIDDEPFYVPGGMFVGFNNKLFSEDMTILGQTAKPWPLIHPDGSIETVIVATDRIPRGSHMRTDEYIDGTMKSTVKRYLGAFAIRTTDDFAYGADFITGVDWNSSITTPIGNAEGITVPMLSMGMTAGWEYISAEMIYEHATSTDKSIAFVEGATHVYKPCTPCETTPGEFGDTVKTLFDHVDGWLSKEGRFL